MPDRCSRRAAAIPITFQVLCCPKGDHSISYSFPNLLVDHAMRNPHVPPGFWRGVNANQNTIYHRVLPRRGGACRRQGSTRIPPRTDGEVSQERWACPEGSGGKRAGWGTPAPDGVHRGLSVCKAFASHIAACAEVSVADDGALKVHRIVAATDSGHAVNPQQIEAQVEGSFVYGLSALFYGACTVKDGRIEQTNFDTYNSLRMAEMPAVETIVMPSGGFWGGVGEPTIAVAAPAVCRRGFSITTTRASGPCTSRRWKKPLGSSSSKPTWIATAPAPSRTPKASGPG